VVIKHTQIILRASLCGNASKVSSFSMSMYVRTHTHTLTHAHTHTHHSKIDGGSMCHASNAVHIRHKDTYSTASVIGHRKIVSHRSRLFGERWFRTGVLNELCARAVRHFASTSGLREFRFGFSGYRVDSFIVSPTIVKTLISLLQHHSHVSPCVRNTNYPPVIGSSR
jgi:hypothetical protein